MSEGGLEPPHPQRVDLQQRGSEHETTPARHRSEALRPRRFGSVVDAVNKAALALALASVAIVVANTPADASTHQGRVVRYAADTGSQWGTYADTQIQKALANDPGDNRPYANASLAQGVATRSPLGWADPVAAHYLDAALSAPNPYGLNYAWDAFHDGTTNPASTVYTITLVQVGEVVLDAYRHGAASYTQVTDIERLIVGQPLIIRSPGISVAYSNSPSDVKAGYSVHNVDQAVGMFLWEIQQAGILWSDTQVKGWISKLYTTERAAYQPKIYGWAYRDGGSQALQDVGHNGVGALYGMIFNPSSLGYPVLYHQMRTNYGYELGGAMHATLSAWDCADSRQWFPEWDQAASTTAVVVSTFDDAARYSRPLAYSGARCTDTAKASKRFALQAVKPALRRTLAKVAPDAVR